MNWNSSNVDETVVQLKRKKKQIHSFAFLVFDIVSIFVFVQCKCVRSLQYVHIIRFEFMRTVFSQIEQIGALRFVAAFLLFCLLFVGVNAELVVDVGPGFVSISPPSNIRWVADVFE